MKSQAVHDFLTARGYKHQPRCVADSESVVANYYRIDRDADVPLCLCNDKQPQFRVTEIYFEFQGRGFHSFEVGFVNESPLGWIDCKFYPATEETIQAQIAEYEAALMEMWKVLFKEAK